LVSNNKKITDMTADELKVFEMVKQSLLKDAPPLAVATTGEMREIINNMEQGEKNKYENSMSLVEILREMLRNIEENKYRDRVK